MEIRSKGEKIRLFVAVSLLASLILVVLALALTGRLTILWHETWLVLKGRDELRIYVESWGSWAPAVFVMLQALQVIMAPIPGELTGAMGGFIFGSLPNILYSTLGLTIGSVIAFLAARLMGFPLVRLVVKEETLDRFHFLRERSGTLLTLLLFAIPGFPKDILSYILGLSPMRLATFVVVCAVGRLPGTLLLSFGGSAAYEANWPVLLAVSVTSLLAVGVLYLWRSRIHMWLNKMGRQDL